jgi:hypothetical protein
VLSLFAAAAEPSRIAFYLAGGAFALWAVILAAVGLRQPEFPYGPRGQRGVMTVSCLLLVITIAAAVLTDP